MSLEVGSEAWGCNRQLKSVTLLRCSSAGKGTHVTTVIHCVQAEACLWSKALITALRDRLFLLRVYQECLTSRAGVRFHLVKERVAWGSVCHRDNRTWVLCASLCQITLGVKPGKQLLSTKITKSRFPTEKQGRLTLTVRQNSHTRLNYETPNPMACPGVNGLQVPSPSFPSLQFPHESTGDKSTWPKRHWG